MQQCFKGRTAQSRDDWETQTYFFRLLDNEFHLTLDPCASIQNHKCAKYFTVLENGLEKNWAGETQKRGHAPPRGGGIPGTAAGLPEGLVIHT